MGNRSVGVAYADPQDMNTAPFAPCSQRPNPRPHTAGTGMVPISQRGAQRPTGVEDRVWSLEPGAWGPVPTLSLELVASTSGSA